MLKAAASPLRVSFVGVGSMGRRHVRVMSQMPEAFTLASGFDTRPSVADWPDTLRRARSEEDAIASADLVVIATPAGAHEASIRRALDAGRHVFVEKPMCTDPDSAADLVALAKERRARILVGHSERFTPTVQALRKRLRETGETLETIVLERRGPSRISDVGVLLNFGVHDFDLAAWLSGERIHLSLVSGRVDAAKNIGRSIDRACDLRFRFGKAGAGRLSLERTKESRTRRISVVTDLATYEGDMLRHELRQRTEQGGERLVVDTSKEPLVLQAHAVRRAIAGEESDVATEASGLCAVELATEALARMCGSLPTKAAHSLVDGEDEAHTRVSAV